MAQEKASTSSPYKVLARKYRPMSFKDNFIGQEATVKVLSAAIKDNKLPHAILLAGTRGIGKTTTARIIARTLNCTKLSFKNGLPDPCGICSSCQSILSDNCLDIIEMDAASRTSVEDIRDLIESLPYKPSICQYKVYIIDEVHMLSKSAFNALLKTLEEPPAHVKFIFATTELNKIPATILSRCMRFDLRPFTQDELKSHLASIAKQERFSIDDEALTLLSDAAKGSARDGLSLLDQARHLNSAISADDVRTMLGRADLTKTAAIFESIIKGQVSEAFTQSQKLIQSGTSPLDLTEGFLSLLHQLNKLRVFPGFLKSVTFSEKDRILLKKMADLVTTPILQTFWHLASKGYEEIKFSPMPEAAFEMLLIRLTHIKNFCEERTPQPSKAVPSSKSIQNTPSTSSMSANTDPVLESPLPQTFADLVTLFREKREALLASNLSQDVHLISYAPGILKFKPTDHAPKDLPLRLKKLLEDWTHTPWQIDAVANSDEVGQQTLTQQREEKIEKLKQEALTSPLVQDVIKAFPGSKVVKTEAIRHN